MLRSLLTAASLAASFPAPAQKFPEFPEPRLKSGRDVWLETCQPCHAEPASGAPQISDKAAWTPRLGKGREALYRSAFQGLVGPKGTEMPARGGNPSLSDEQVRAAVDYMTTAVSR